MVITVDNQTDFPLPTSELESIANSLSSRDIELIICNNATIRFMNAQFRSKDIATDVLSFPLESMFDTTPLGSIVISSDMIFQKAEELGHTPQEESIILFIHGILHLLGYDHERDDTQMRDREAEIVEAFGLPKSLIIRTHN